VTERLSADHVGICKFHVELPPKALPSVLEPEMEKWKAGEPTPLGRKLAADALGAMRTKSARVASLRIVVGGKVRGWSGWLPGIAEEVLASLQLREASGAGGAGHRGYAAPFVILGGLGGCAGALADFLVRPEEGEAEPLWPESLTFREAESQDGDFRALLAHPGAREEAFERFQRLETELHAFRDHLRQLEPAEAVFVKAEGITRQVFEGLLQEVSPRTILDQVRTVAHDIRAPGASHV
jgi:SLOG cluster2